MEVSTYPYVGICTECKKVVFLATPEGAEYDSMIVERLLSEGISIERHPLPDVVNEFSDHDAKCSKKPSNTIDD